MLRSQAQDCYGLLLCSAVMLSSASAYAIDPVVPPSAPLASSFPGPLWDLVTPAGGTATVSKAHLYLSVPGGSNHDALRPSNQTIQVVQPIGDQDFDVSIKIDSPVTAANADTSQGLIIRAGDKDFITFALMTDGTHISLNVRSVDAGAETTLFNEADFNEYQNPMCLRLSRSGAEYKAYYSVDGVIWTQAASFTDARVPSYIGPFAGNYNGNPAKAVPFVMAINWFNVL